MLVKVLWYKQQSTEMRSYTPAESTRLLADWFAGLPFHLWLVPSHLFGLHTNITSRTGVPNLPNLVSDNLKWSWGNHNRNKVHKKCNVLESSPNHLHLSSCKNHLPWFWYCSWYQNGWRPLSQEVPSKIALSPWLSLPLSFSHYFTTSIYHSGILFLFVHLFIVCFLLLEGKAFMWICPNYCCFPRNELPEFSSLNKHAGRHL